MSTEISQRLRAARAKLVMTQRGMAKHLGVPLPTLTRWEQNLNTPRGLALEALNAKLDAILRDAS